MSEPSKEFMAEMKVLSPEDRKAVMEGFSYRLNFPGGAIEYTRSLQEAVDKRRRKAGESQAQTTALPWERKPNV